MPSPLMGQRLFDARDIYKPIQTTRAPMVHSVSVCPLGGDNRGDELDCRTTAFVGPSQREFFVSTSDIYLWVTPNRWRDAPNEPCPGMGALANAGADAFAVPAALYQVPLSGAPPRAVHTRGQPTNQLAMDASATEFRALLGWNTSRCNEGSEAHVRYFRVPLNSLATTPQTAPARSYTETPSVPTGNYEVRFTGTHAVYGGRSQYGSYPPAENTAPRTARVIAVPVAQPRAYAPIEAPHDILRIERTGANIVLTGYRDDAGLSLSNLDLRSRPRLTDTQVLSGRFESENRSHAFNSMVGADGAGLMGLPTVTRIKQSGRWVWRRRLFRPELSLGRRRRPAQRHRRVERAPRRRRSELSLRSLVHRLVWQYARALHRQPRIRALGNRVDRRRGVGRTYRRTHSAQSVSAAAARDFEPVIYSLPAGEGRVCEPHSHSRTCASH